MVLRNFNLSTVHRTFNLYYYCTYVTQESAMSPCLTYCAAAFIVTSGVGPPPPSESGSVSCSPSDSGPASSDSRLFESELTLVGVTASPCLCLGGRSVSTSPNGLAWVLLFLGILCIASALPSCNAVDNWFAHVEWKIDSLDLSSQGRTTFPY